MVADKQLRTKNWGIAKKIVLLCCFFKVMVYNDFEKTSW